MTSHLVPTKSPLLQPLHLGLLNLPNLIVMVPMTRSRPDQPRDVQNARATEHFGGDARGYSTYPA